MNAAGVIVEFNPLHNGHIEHLHQTKRLTHRDKIIAVMSGNFVQRGEPALCDKWRRTHMALLAGVDIVIELPVPYVVSGADYFARGSVKLLGATGVVDRLCFGSEIGDIKLIKEAGRVLAFEPDEYKAALHDGLGRGFSFAAARGAALAEVLGVANTKRSSPQPGRETAKPGDGNGSIPDGLLTKPNNGLGMEYCKALWQMGWPMEVYTSYRGAGGASATAIRKAVWDGVASVPSWLSCDPYASKSGNARNKTIIGEAAESMPQYVCDILIEAIEAGEIARLDDYYEIFRYLLFTRDIVMGEGLENRFRHFAKQALYLATQPLRFTKRPPSCAEPDINEKNTIESPDANRPLTALMDAVKTKRYTYTRLQRAVTGVVLGMQPADLAAYENTGGPGYIRVLGFRRDAAGLLGEMTRRASLPVLTTGHAMDKLAGLNAKMLAKELEVGDIYRMAFGGAAGYRHERGVPLVVV